MRLVHSMFYVLLSLPSRSLNELRITIIYSAFLLLLSFIIASHHSKKLTKKFLSALKALQFKQILKKSNQILFRDHRENYLRIN